MQESGRLRLHFSGIVQGVGFRPFLYRAAEKFGLKGFGQEHQRRRDPGSRGRPFAGVRPLHHAPRPAPEPHRDPAPGKRSRSAAPGNSSSWKATGQGAEECHGLARHRPLRRLRKRDGRSRRPALCNTLSPTAPTAARASPSSPGCPTTGRKTTMKGSPCAPNASANTRSRSTGATTPSPCLARIADQNCS